MPTKHLGTGDSFAAYIDLLQHELRNAQIQNLSSAPSTPVEGQIYHDTTLHELRFYNGSGWVNCDGSTFALSGDVTGALGSTVVGKVNGVTVSAAAATIAAALAGGTTRSATATLAAGEETVFTGSSSTQTLTLPATPQHSSINKIANYASVSVTVAAGSGDAINYEGTTGSITLAAGETLEMVYLGTSWYVLNLGLTARAITASLSSYLTTATAATTYMPLGGGTFTGNLTSNGTAKVTGLPTPSGSSDAATKGYVDGVAQGLSAKPSVTVVATTALSAAPATGGLLTVDGVVLTAGQRVLATAQATASQNGIWVVAAGAWTRPVDFATGASEIGTYVMAEQGTANSGSGWVMTGAAIVVDTDAQTWVVFSRAATTLGKYTVTIGDGASTSFTITHNLGSKDVVLVVRQASDDTVVEADWVAATTSTCTVTFASAPASNAYKVAVIG